MDRESAPKMKDTGSIPARVKTNTIKIGIHSFPACQSALKRDNVELYQVLWTDGQVAA